MSTPITNLVEQAILERLSAKVSFTALDVSNDLKTRNYPVRHGDVARVVRDVYASGAMDYYDYRRELISVITDDGGKLAQAFLYHHQETRGGDYTARDQQSLPPVPPDRARDLRDSVAAGPAPLPARHRPKTNSSGTARSGRRDGALAVPRSLVAQMGWAAGVLLGLAAEGDGVVLKPGGQTPVRVWSGQRVRICKLKLRGFGLKADVVHVTADGGGLRLEEKH